MYATVCDINSLAGVSPRENEGALMAKEET